MALKEAIILCGGQGTRLRTVVSDVPKPMASIQGKPFLEIIIEHFYKKGITHFILSVGYLSDIIIEHFSKKYPSIRLSFSVERTPLGTGGAVRLAMTKVTSEQVLILNGDSLFDVDLTVLEDCPDEQTPIIFGRVVDDVSRYGQLIYEGMTIKHYAEKTGTGPGCINGGVYVFNKHLLDAYPLYQPFSIENDFFSKISPQQPAYLMVSDGYFIDIGLPETYYHAQTELTPYLSS